MLTALEWLGAIGGASGALLLAFNCRWSGYGFVLFLGSNAAWLTYGMLTDTYGMVAMQVVCTFTSLIGVWRWLIQPRKVASYRDDSDMLPSEVIFQATRGRGVLQEARNG